ncbi:MAG TPA: universal stress protein [Blastocatellia bacterium]|nr:universal stress protein [Blastocatellia bacterium]
MIAFNKILCPTDLTPASDEVLRYATALANTYNATLLIAHCNPNLSPDQKSIQQTMDSVRRAIEKRIQNGLLINGYWQPIVLFGDPLEKINRAAFEHEANLVVVGSNHGPVPARVLGSTAESICHTSPCSVLVMHPGEYEAKPNKQGELKRILVAHDFSADAQLALQHAISLSRVYESELHLIHVVSPHAKYESAFAPATVADFGQLFEAEQRLNRVLVTETTKWNEAKSSVSKGNPYNEILEYARKQEIDLICIGIKRSPLPLPRPFGTTVDRVLHQTRCPVLVARPSRGFSFDPKRRWNAI